MWIKKLHSCTPLKLYIRTKLNSVSSLWSVQNWIVSYGIILPFQCFYSVSLCRIQFWDYFVKDIVHLIEQKHKIAISFFFLKLDSTSMSFDAWWRVVSLTIITLFCFFTEWPLLDNPQEMFELSSTISKDILYLHTIFLPWPKTFKLGYLCYMTE